MYKYKPTHGDASSSRRREQGNDELVGWLCLTSHREQGHLETAPPFAVPCEGREAR